MGEDEFRDQRPPLISASPSEGRIIVTQRLFMSKTPIIQP
jgi:hypothetical protein